jgi:hypothetical protein
MNSADMPSAPDAESHGLLLPTRAKGKRTAEELAAMIHHDLSQIEGCPSAPAVTLAVTPIKS